MSESVFYFGSVVPRASCAVSSFAAAPQQVSLGVMYSCVFLKIAAPSVCVALLTAADAPPASRQTETRNCRQTVLVWIPWEIFSLVEKQHMNWPNLVSSVQQ